MRRSRRNHHEVENHERWLVSYADFITLLFAFFVVMYAISSVNEGKYRVLSEVMVEAFRSPPRSMKPIQVGELMRSPVRDPIERISRSDVIMPVPDLRPVAVPLIQQDLRPVLDRAEPLPPAPAETQPPPPDQPSADPLDEVMVQLKAAMSELIEADIVKLRRTDRWVELEITNSILFPSGSADLGPQAMQPLQRIAGVLKEIPNRVQVEGFTDNVPISNPVFPSNWELSAARAASVVHLLARAGVRPERMAAIGYGEFRPVASNATEEGRRRNRRVVMVIVGDDALRNQTRLSERVPARSLDLAAGRP